MKTFRHLTVLAVLLLGACTTTPPAPQGGEIVGSLTYRGQGQVPPGAKADVTVSDPAHRDAPLLSQSLPAGDGHAAVPFRLAFVPAQLPPGPSYMLRAQVRDAAGNLLWVSHETRPIDAAQPHQDLGAVALTPVLPKPSFPKPGTKPIQLGYVAQGSQPDWMLHVVGRKLMLESNDGALKIETATPPRRKIPGGYRYLAHAGKQAVRIDVLNRECGGDNRAPYPDTVTVTAGGRTLHGCGGDPAGALQHTRWMVHSIDGQQVASRSRPTLVFEITGRVAGHASCNSYSGPYKVGSENGLRFGNLVSTRRACAPALMQQEGAMLAVLNEAVRYELANGSLTIETNDGRQLVARKG
jgi:heat shock protein HslJ/uncharacterized lipoprotein YbaY